MTSGNEGASRVERTVECERAGRTWGEMRGQYAVRGRLLRNNRHGNRSYCRSSCLMQPHGSGSQGSRGLIFKPPFLRGRWAWHGHTGHRRKEDEPKTEHRNAMTTINYALPAVHYASSFSGTVVPVRSVTERQR